MAGADPGRTARLNADLASRRAEAVCDTRARAKQHPRGKLTARERIALLADAGSFVETGELAGCGDAVGDAVVTGHATVDGRRVCLFSQDFSVFGGSLGQVCGEKMLKVMDLATKIGCPVVGINDSGGARVQEGVVSLAYYAELGRRNSLASGIIPQISVILGPCAGGAVYAPAITDFVVMADGISHMFVTGPDVVTAVTGEHSSAEELGGAHLNSAVSGNAHYLAEDEHDALDWVRTLLGYLPGNNTERPPVYAPGGNGRTGDLDLLIPDSPREVYDMRRVLEGVLDDSDYLEVQPLFGPNMLCAFGRVDGRTVGVVANQPLHNAGTIDIDASEKAARFVRFCDAFGVPLLTFADVPGYLPGAEQERQGIIRRGAKLIYAYSEATVPKVTVVVRKAYGGGYAVMGSKHLGADVNFAWPTAEIAVMGAEGAVSLLHRRELAEAAANGTAEAVHRKLVEEYRTATATPYVAAERGYVDAVIRPSETRDHVSRALGVLATKDWEPLPRKHGNIPL
ncbi:acyl-CoA carboxylase subunit beta [Saccharopolyspora taberi]|uniref:Acyl-CoA carboxylase subunit beta n=1 Tax=Saccharopolyspora taberi TaxID=60895 RepID=A0ABN3VAQ2_9PSEU